MQTTIASVTRPTAVPPSQTDASTDANGGQWGSYNLIRRNGSVVGFEPSKIAIAMTKAFLAVNGGQGAASARVRELVESLTKQVVNALVRNRPGGGTFHIEDVQDQVELALMRSGEHDVARSYVLYRESAPRNARQPPRPTRSSRPPPRSRPVAERDRQRRAPSARYRRPARHHRSRRRGPDRVHRHRSDPEGNRQESVRRHPRGRSVQVRHPVRPRAGRERPGLQPGHCPPAAAHDPQGSAGPGSLAGRHEPALRRLLPHLHLARDRRRPAVARPVPIRPGQAGPGAGRQPRPAVRLPRPANSVRPLLPAHPRHPHRTAAGLLHARGHGPGAERDQPRSARHRVLRDPVLVRLHELHAHAVQLGHAALAAVVVLPDHGLGRPGRHLRRHQGKRAAGQVRRRPGQRLDPGARAAQPHQGHQRRKPGRGPVPEGGQRHRRGGEPGRQAQGRGLHVPGNLAPGHRGIPRTAQEHRRRTPPHARHEHGELDSRPVHEARHGKRRMDPVLALRLPRPARQVRP